MIPYILFKQQPSAKKQFFFIQEKYIPYVGAAGLLLHKNIKAPNEKIYVVDVSFPTEMVFLDHWTDRVIEVTLPQENYDI